MLLRWLELRKIVMITPTHCQRAGYATSDQPPFFTFPRSLGHPLCHSLDLWGHFFPERAGKNNSMFILWNTLTFSLKSERNSYIVLSFGEVCMGMVWLILTGME